MKNIQCMALLLIAATGVYTTYGGISGVVITPVTFDTAATAGLAVWMTCDGVSFKMVYVPGGLTFPTGTNDEGKATVTNAYFVGEIEVTYQLWNAVYTWATDTARGTNQYHFSNVGTQGDNGRRGIQHPVTKISWRDSMVWCNALTEWYNAKKGTNHECVYTYSGAIIRDSRGSNAAACDGAVASAAAKGFRLLSSDEWELAARYRDGSLWTYGDHASGDDSGACYDDGSILGGIGMSSVFGNFAVYYDNSRNSTSSVGSKRPNALGLYDMSGNVWEWCFDVFESGPDRMGRGGSYDSNANTLRVGHRYFGPANSATSGVGFRLAKSR